MIIKDNKIIETTENELYSYWLENWEMIMTYDEYKQRMKDKGVIINEDK